MAKILTVKIKHHQFKKISSKFEGKSECHHYTPVKHYGKTTGTLDEFWVRLKLQTVNENKRRNRYIQITNLIFF